MAAVAGLVLILRPYSVLNIFPILAGAVLVINGISNLIQASQGEGAPGYSRIVAIVIIIIGALLIFRPFRIWDALVFIMGAALVLNGLADRDIEGAIRFSLSRFNTREEIDETIEKTAAAVRRFRRLGSFR